MTEVLRIKGMAYHMKRKRRLFWKVYIMKILLRQLHFNHFLNWSISEKGKNHFEVLPENWVQVTHNSGMPIYLHKPTRVCTLAKPYFLGPGSARVYSFWSHFKCFYCPYLFYHQSMKYCYLSEMGLLVSGNIPAYYFFKYDCYYNKSSVSETCCSY